MIVFGAVRPGRNSLGIFLPWTPRRQVPPFTSGGGGLCYVPPLPRYVSCLGICSVSACHGGEGRRLSSAACDNLPHRWLLACCAVAVPPFS